MAELKDGDECIDAWTLIVGEKREFCLTVYGALLGRFPDRDAVWHYDTIPVDAEARAEEIRRVLDSVEFSANNRQCVFGDDTPVPDLDDRDLRFTNFFRHVLPALVSAVMHQNDLASTKATEIGDLIREILVESYSGEIATSIVAQPTTSHLDNDRLDAVGQEIEALKKFVQWELPKRILRQVNHTIMTNAAELERQMRTPK